MRRPTRTLLLVLALVLAAAAMWYVAGDRLMALAGGGGSSQGQAGGPRAVPVEVAPVERGSVLVTVETTGELRARETVQVTMDAQGLVREVAFREGEQVDGGQLLVRLDAEEEQARLQEAIARREQAEIDLERARDLAEENFEAEARVDELETQLEAAEAAVAIARAELNERTVEAPFAGWIGLRLVSPGALIEPGTAIAELWSSGHMDVRFEVPAAFGPRLEQGQTVIARSDALPDGRIDGELRVIEFAVAGETRTISLEATFDNPDGRLRPGTFLEIELVLEERENALLVPEEAILLRGSDAYVYVVGEDQTVARRAVRIGERRQGEAEIVDGLKGGEQVVVAGLQTISDGQKVRTITPDAGQGSGSPEGGGSS